jgi:hypothetical protein
VGTITNIMLNKACFVTNKMYLDTTFGDGLPLITDAVEGVKHPQE